jgi:membrane dipeptidase
MVTFVPRFVSQAVRDWDRGVLDLARARGTDERDLAAYAVVQAEQELEQPSPPSTIADVASHLDHVREVAGIDHIGLGGDYDGVVGLAEGLEDVSCYPRLVAALRQGGWSETDLAKLTCRNILRTMRDVEDVARLD